jgi:hypothetical protein
MPCLNHVVSIACMRVCLRPSYGCGRSLVQEKTRSGPGCRSLRLCIRRHFHSHYSTESHSCCWVSTLSLLADWIFTILVFRFRWTMRILAFIIIGLLLIPNLTLRRRLPPERKGTLFNINDFKNPAFTVYCAVAFINYLGIYTSGSFIS